MVLVALFAPGCVSVEGGLKYEYAGRLLRTDGKTPVNNAAVRLARTTAPEQSDHSAKTDKSARAKSGKDGRYHGTVETKKGWGYSQVFGAHVGPTRPPEPPPLGEVVVYVQEHGGPWVGYKLTLPPGAEAEASAGVRKVRLPDLLLPDAPATTRSTTAPSTQPATAPGQAPAAQ